MAKPWHFGCRTTTTSLPSTLVVPGLGAEFRLTSTTVPLALDVPRGIFRRQSLTCIGRSLLCDWMGLLHGFGKNAFLSIAALKSYTIAWDKKMIRESSL